MTKGIQIRRGTTSQHSSFTGREGEITVDTTKQVVVVHDNLTAGGYPLVSETLPQTVTNKTVIAGSSSTTGTASQPLQVVGGAYVSGNLGVGVTNPSNKLEVNGQVHIYSSTDDYVKLLNDAGSIEISRSSGDAYIDLKNSNSEDFDARIQSKGSTGTLRLQGATDVEVVAGSATGLYVVNTGRVGVGTTIPTGDLQVGTGITMSATSGIISATTLRPAGGTTTSAPIQFTSGTNLATQTAGSLEYNGSSFFATQNASTGRGMVLAPTIVRIASTLTHGANNTLESLFDAANDTLSLTNDTLYWFRGVLLLNKAANASTNTLNIAFTFSNAVQSITYQYETYTTAATTTLIQRANVTVSTTNAIDPTGTGAANYYVKLEGWFRTNATTGGTLIPQYTQTVSAQPAVVADSWLMVQPMASGNPTLLAGGWA